MKFFTRILIIVISTMMIAACNMQSIDSTDPLSTTTALPTVSTNPPTTITPLPLIQPVQLAWFWNSPRNEELIPAVAESFDFFVFTSGDEEERAQLRASSRSDMPVLQYMLFNGVGVPENCEIRPYGNQIANQRGDFCEIRDQHPDWLIYDSSGNMIYNDDQTYVRANPSNKEWRQFFATRLQQTQQAEGWDGVFLDNVDASLGRSKRMGLTVPLFQTDAELQAANEEMLAYLYLNYYQPSGRPMFANITFLKHEAIWYRYLRYLDGAMVEDFAVGWNSDYKEADQWEWQMNLVEGAQGMGKEVILVSQGEQNDTRRQEFAFASYLLVNQGHAYFRYSIAREYNQLWLYNNYNIELGQPLGRRYQRGENWVREFEKGTVMVNPTELTSQIILN